MNCEKSLLDSWEIICQCCFWILVFFLGLSIRLIVTFLKTFDDDKPFSKFWYRFFNLFSGWPKEDVIPKNDKNKPKDGYADRLLTFILGLFELSIYPVLMVTGYWSFIGAWLGFKAIAQWNMWAKNRNSFIRFLIGNILVLLAAFFLLTRYVKLKCF